MTTLAVGLAALALGLPLGFEPNRGQTDPAVKFVVRGDGYAVFLAPTEAALAFHDAGVLRLRLLGANASAVAEGIGELPGKSHYFVAADPARALTNIPTYAKVLCRGVYPGIDVVYYGNQRELEHDFVLAPSADPSAIRVALDGATHVVLDEQGDVVVKSGGADVRLRKPSIYQERNGAKTAVDGRYVLYGAQAAAASVGFEIGDYDRTRPLIIDPVISYSALVGGSGYDTGYDIAVDGSGNLYVAGTTRSINFPKVAALQGSYGGSTNDAFVMRLNAKGDQIVYSTFLGGTANDYGYGVAVDGEGRAHVAGGTFSHDFYPADVTPNRLQLSNHGEGDAFYARLAPDGKLDYASYLGGGRLDVAFDIAVDEPGAAYLTGHTFSANFPAKFPLYPDLNGTRDAFVSKIHVAEWNPTTHLVYSTYLGGGGQEDGWGIAVDGESSAHVTGQTCSDDFPATRNSFQGASHGACDGFVAKLAPDGSSPLLYATYLGGTGWDKPNAIAVDASGEAHIVGETTSSLDFPNVGQSLVQNTWGGGQYDAFIAWLDVAGGAARPFTYFGGSGDDYAIDVAADGQGGTYVTGYTTTNDSSFPQVEALQGFGGGQYDAFAAKIDGGSTVAYSSYLGGKANDFGYGIAVDSQGSAYLTGHTASPDFDAPQTIPGATVAAPRAYVTNSTSGTVSVIDTATSAVDTVSVQNGTQGLVGVAISPDGARVYVSNSFTNTVSAIDARTLAIITSESISGKPKGLALSPDGSVLYVGKSEGSSVTALDSTTLAEVGLVTVSGLYPAGIAVSPDGTRAYVANGNDMVETVAVLELGPSGQIVQKLTEWDALTFAAGIAVTPLGDRVYVAMAGDDVIRAYDSQTGQFDDIEIDDGGVQSFPYGLALTPDGKRLYVANQIGHSFCVIDTEVGSPTYHADPTPIPVPGAAPSPKGVSVTPDGQRLYITNNGGSTVTIVDTSTNQVVGAISVGNGPEAFGRFIGPPVSGGDAFVMRID